MEFTATGYARDLFIRHIPEAIDAIKSIGTNLRHLSNAQEKIALEMAEANRLKAIEVRNQGANVPPRVI